MDEEKKFDDVYSSAYEELRRLASSVRRHEAHFTLNSTALVNEAWLKLKGSPHLASIPEDRFKGIAARAMRQILIAAARQRNAQKRGGVGRVFVTFDESLQPVASSGGELLALDAALEKLERMDSRQAKMVEYRFFVGLNEQETADLLGVAKSTVQRDWVAAKAFLNAEVRGALANPGVPR